MSSSIRLIALGALVVALSLPQCVQAACGKTLTVAVSPLGFSLYHERDGRLAGVVVDLMRELTRRSGCEFRLVERPRARAVLEFESGLLDMLSSAVRSPERDAFARYVHYSYTQLDLVLAPGVRAGGLKDFIRTGGRARLGYVRGSFLGAQLKSQLAALQHAQRADEASDYDNLLQRLIAGRIQAALIPSVIHGRMRQTGELGRELRVVPISDAPPLPIGIYFHTRTVAAADIARLQALLREMLQDGSTERLYLPYIGAAEAARLFHGTAAREQGAVPSGSSREDRP